MDILADVDELVSVETISIHQYVKEYIRNPVLIGVKFLKHKLKS